jgi:hypothetical protein
LKKRKLRCDEITFSALLAGRACVLNDAFSAKAAAKFDADHPAVVSAPTVGRCSFTSSTTRVDSVYGYSACRAVQIDIIMTRADSVYGYNA